MKENIEIILDEIKNTLISLGFEYIEVNGIGNYKYKELYCVPAYIAELGFLIEYAESYDEAIKGRYEDGDSCLFSFSKTEIVKFLRDEIIGNMKSS